MLIKIGESLIYWLEVASGESGVGQVLLEYTDNGGITYTTEVDEAGAKIDWTGTAGSPLQNTVDIGYIKNESNKDKLYRFRCVSFGATSDNILWCLKNNAPNRKHLYGDVYHIWGDNAPDSGSDGDGVTFAGPQSIYTQTAHPWGIYQNQGTITFPVWVKIN